MDFREVQGQPLQALMLFEIKFVDPERQIFVYLKGKFK
jgi:hypothetical protein